MLIKLLNNYILYYFLKSVYLHHVHEINGKRDIQMNLVLYTKNNCIQCKMTKKFLKAHNINFVEHNIDEQPEFINSLKSEGFMATPVVKLPNGNAFSGFRPDELNKLTQAI